MSVFFKQFCINKGKIDINVIVGRFHSCTYSNLFFFFSLMFVKWPKTDTLEIFWPGNYKQTLLSQIKYMHIVQNNKTKRFFSVKQCM